MSASGSAASGSPRRSSGPAPTTDDVDDVAAEGAEAVDEADADAAAVVAFLGLSFFGACAGAEATTVDGCTAAVAVAVAAGVSVSGSDGSSSCRSASSGLRKLSAFPLLRIFALPAPTAAAAAAADGRGGSGSGWSAGSE